MHVEFYSSNPYEPFGRTFTSLLNDATHVDAAIAFVTRRGLIPIRDYLRRQKSLRLLASVRFPTDLDALANLAEELPGQVYIHTGYMKPQEDQRERGQFHSKVVLIHGQGTDRHIIVGSHNWTQNAMEGFNLEASTIVTCDESDRFVADARRHIENCISVSEAFDHDKLPWYRELQKQLDDRPGNREHDLVSGFAREPALVIHAEYDGADNELQLYVPLVDPATRRFFVDATENRRVFLFAYPPGFLQNPKGFAGSPAFYAGEVTMDNDVGNDDPVERRPATHGLSDLQRPVVHNLQGNVPPVGSEVRQVMIRLRRQGISQMPIFHSDRSAPYVKFDVDYGDADDNLYRIWRSRPKHLIHQDIAQNTQRDVPRFTVPKVFRETIVIKVPNADLYPFSISDTIRQSLGGQTELPLDGAEDDGLEAIAATRDKGSRIQLDIDVKEVGGEVRCSDYVYLVYYRYSSHRVDAIP